MGKISARWRWRLVEALERWQNIRVGSRNTVVVVATFYCQNCGWWNLIYRGKYRFLPFFNRHRHYNCENVKIIDESDRPYTIMYYNQEKNHK